MLKKNFLIAFAGCMLWQIAAASLSFAYVLWDPYGNGKNVKWPDSAIPVPYYLDSAGSADVSMDKLVKAVEDSFAAWTSVPATYIAVEKKGQLPGLEFADDGRNSLFWIETVTTEMRTFISQNTIGVTILSGESELLAGVMTDVDIGFNGDDFDWSAEPTGQTGKMDVQDIATHEIGHFFGLDHTDKTDEKIVMYPFATYGEVEHRTLKDDDQEGIAAIYPYQGVVNFSASPVSIADASWIVLSWQNTSRQTFVKTLVRYRTDGVFPTGPTDGILLTELPGTPHQAQFFSHTGVTPNTTYYYTAFAYDQNVGFNVPDQNGQRAVTAIGIGGAVDSSGRNSTGCFIATLCYGNINCPEVKALRAFRDKFLMRTYGGQTFVNYYYATSPEICRLLDKQKPLQQAVRLLLEPIATLARVGLGGGK